MPMLRRSGKADLRAVQVWAGDVGLLGLLEPDRGPWMTIQFSLIWLSGFLAGVSVTFIAQNHWRGDV